MKNPFAKFNLKFPKISDYLPKFGLDDNYQMRLNLYIITSGALGILLLLSILDWAGNFGGFIGGLMALLVGRGAILIPFICWFWTWVLIRIQREREVNKNLNIRLGWGILFMIWTVLAFMNMLFGVESPDQVEIGGGFIGYILYPYLLHNTSSIFDLGVIGSCVVLFGIGFFGFFLTSQKKYTEFIDGIKDLFNNPDKFWDLIPDVFDLWHKPELVEIATSDDDQEALEFSATQEDQNSHTDFSLDDTLHSQLQNPLQDATNYFNDLDTNNSDNSDNSDQENKPQISAYTEEDEQDIFEEGDNLPLLSPNISKFISENSLGSDSRKQIKWQKPALDLLYTNTVKKVEPTDIDEKKLKIKNTFSSFGIDVVMGEAITGPTISQFTFRPASGIKLSKINSLQNDLALSLAAKSIRMELPIPGMSLASIEIPNSSRTPIRIKDLLSSSQFQKFVGELPIAIGTNVSGDNIIFSLCKTPHLLVAGATGSGKSVWINSLLLSLLYKYSPVDLQLVMVDMKMVELTLYNNIPHLLTPVITESDKVINALRWSVAEMNARYKLLTRFGKRNIADYNEFAVASKSIEKMPYIVFIIDELADLMMQAKTEVEPLIARLTAMSRAVGIHLVLGTQRPDTTVVTGLIKTNVPTRICFAVATQIDSRVILDTGGGETLLGQGDGLFKNPMAIQPTRFQGAYVDEKEVKEVVDVLIEQKVKNKFDNYNPDVIEPPAGMVTLVGNRGKIDPENTILIYEEAKKLVVELGQCSPNILAGNLKIELKQAKQLIEELEVNGIVGPEIGGMSGREVLVV